MVSVPDSGLTTQIISNEMLKKLIHVYGQPNLKSSSSDAPFWMASLSISYLEATVVCFLFSNFFNYHLTTELNFGFSYHQISKNIFSEVNKT